MNSTNKVRILHLSDTHCLHGTIETIHPMPAADILIHSGDFTSRGYVEEFEDFNDWLGTIKHRYKFIVVIMGNHEWKLVSTPKKARSVKQATDQLELANDPNRRERLAAMLSNATHVLEHQSVDLMGLTIFGSAWCPYSRGNNPDRVAKSDVQRLGTSYRARWDEIPPNVDVLVTHGPPRGIFDLMEGTGRHWGSSAALRKRIVQVAPALHLFGHLHEQRGCFVKMDDGSYRGGVEYERVEGRRWPENECPAPAPDYPCQIISCNAMKNHGRIEQGDRARPQIFGPGRLIVADLVEDKWKFSI